MSGRIASGLSSLLGILYAPVIYALVLQIMYNTDPISVLLQGPLGWFHYTLAAFVALIITMVLVTLTMAGGRRATGR